MKVCSRMVKNMGLGFIGMPMGPCMKASGGMISRRGRVNTPMRRRMYMKVCSNN